MTMPEERIVTMKVRLPLAMADDAERIHDADANYFRGVVLAAVARKRIYEGLRADEEKRLSAHMDRQA